MSCALRRLALSSLVVLSATVFASVSALAQQQTAAPAKTMSAPADCKPGDKREECKQAKKDQKDKAKMEPSKTAAPAQEKPKQ